MWRASGFRKCQNGLGFVLLRRKRKWSLLNCARTCGFWAGNSNDQNVHGHWRLLPRDCYVRTEGVGMSTLMSWKMNKHYFWPIRIKYWSVVLDELGLKKKKSHMDGQCSTLLVEIHGLTLVQGLQTSWIKGLMCVFETAVCFVASLPFPAPATDLSFRVNT